MAIEKQINTKISLRYLDYNTWSAESFASEKPLKGEVWFCAVPAGNANATTAPTMLFKVGDGVNTFGNLKWGSALAADVYGWAKKENLDLADLPDIPVVDTETGKFVTDIEWDAAKNQFVVHRGDVAWGDITGKPNLVNSIKATDDDVVVLTPETAASGDVTITGAHAKKGPSAGYTGSTNIKGGTAVVGTELDIKVPVLTVDAYGHTNAVNEASYKITIPKATAPNDGELTLKASNGLTATEKVFTANDTNDVTFEVSHADTSDATNLVADGRKYVTGLTFDDYGHVTGYTTGSESDQDLSNYKTLQSVYSKELTGAQVVAKVEQNANGDVTVTERTLTAADLGLDTVMHFIGAYAVAPTKAFAGASNERDLANGDVYLNTANATEYVYSNGKWVELGNEEGAGSHALKTISIMGADGLTGGGTLEQDRTITHAVPSNAAEGDHKGTGERTYITNVKTDKFGHVVGIETGTEVDDGITSIDVSGDAEVSLNVVEEKGTVTITAAHTAHAAGEAKTASAATIADYDGTGTIKIPKIVTNAAGHVTEISEETVTITMPSRQEIPEASGNATIASVSGDVVTLKTSAALNADHTLTNGDGEDITLAKVAKTGSAYDLAEANVGTDKDGNEVLYFVLDCNW